MKPELITIDANVVRQIAAEWRESNATSNVGQQLFLLLGTGQPVTDVRGECANIARTEYEYWRPRMDGMEWDAEGIGAACASANILCGIKFGRPQPKDDTRPPLHEAKLRMLAAEAAIMGGGLETLLQTTACAIEMLESAAVQAEEMGGTTDGETYCGGLDDAVKQWDNFVFKLRGMLSLTAPPEPFPRPHVQGVEATL